MFILQYTRQEKYITWRNMVPLWILPICFTLLAMTNEFHHLIWSSFGSMVDPITNVLVYIHDPAFWVYLFFHILLNVFAGFVLLRNLIRKPSPFRAQTILLVITVCLPLIGGVLYAFGLNPFPGLDLTPFSFTLSVVLVAFAIYRFQLFDLVPFARDVLFENLTEGVIVLDSVNRIIDINPSVKKFLGIVEKDLIGLPVKEVFAGYPELIKLFQKDQHVELALRHQKGMMLSVLVKLITLQDVSDRVKAEEKLKYLSTHDALTGLFNRNFFEAEMQRLQSGRSFPISILVMDLDKLKEINDRNGHDAGDLLLREVARVFRETFRADDITARLGGDEFVVLLLRTDESTSRTVLKRFLENLRIQRSIPGQIHLQQFRKQRY